MSNNTILKIKTWHCLTCGYTAPGSMDPFSDRFVAKYPGVQVGGCPSCATHPSPEHRKHCSLEFLEGADLNALVTTNTASDAEIESNVTEDLDEHGQPIMVQTGERQEIGIVNGQIGIITVPVYEPKMRSLTPQELAELKEQRDRNLDALEGIAV